MSRIISINQQSLIFEKYINHFHLFLFCFLLLLIDSSGENYGKNSKMFGGILGYHTHRNFKSALYTWHEILDVFFNYKNLD